MFKLVAAILVLYVVACYGQNSTISSSVFAPSFRTSPITSTCGSDKYWFQTPCFTSRQYATSFYQPSSNTAITGSGFLSLVVVNKTNGNGPNIYAGLTTNYILNIQLPTSTPITTVQTITPNIASGGVVGNWTVSVMDTDQTIVLFGSSSRNGATIVKFIISDSGLLNQSATTNLAINNLASGYYNPSTKFFYFGGDAGALFKVDPNTLASSKVQFGSSNPGSIQCIIGSGNNMLSADSVGNIFATVSVAGAVDDFTGNLTIPSEGFGGACGSTTSYGIFVSLAKSIIYQISYPGVSIGGVTYSATNPTVAYSLSGLMPNGYFFTSAMNADSTAFYVASTQQNLPINARVSEIIYEFRLYPTRIDFSSAVNNPKQGSLTNIYSSASIGNTILWGTSINTANTNFTQGVPYYSGMIVFMVSSSLGSLPVTNKLSPTYKIPNAPSNNIGQVGSIADTSQFIANGNLLVANGIGVYPQGSTPSPVAPRGPLTTYLRGSNTEGVLNGGDYLGNQTMAIQLLGIDEHSLNYFLDAESDNENETVTTINPLVYRSVPFLSSADAPWSGSIVSPHISWVLGNDYPYPIPPSVSQVNGSVLVAPGSTTKPATNTSTSTRSAIDYKINQAEYIQNFDTETAGGQQGSRKRALNYAGASIPGYSQFGVDLYIYDSIKNLPGTIVYNYDPLRNLSVGYNTTSRTMAYTVSVTSWTFLQLQKDLSSIRINLTLGFGSNSTELVSVTTESIPYNNISTSTYSNRTFMIRTTFQMNTCYWTLVLPQLATIYPGGLVPTTFPTTYNNQTGIVSIYLPTFATTSFFGQTKGVVQTYTFYVEYEYNPPPFNPGDLTSPTPTWKKLIPLYIVVGICVGLILCIVCIALIVGLVIGIIKFRRWRDKVIEDKLDKSEKMLGDNF